VNTELSRKLRRERTSPEQAMWNILHQFRQQGHHFRRQVKLGSYYVDFAKLEEAIVIEVDGGTHAADEAVAKDAVRDRYLTARGYKVLRFWNNDVLMNPDGVCRMLELALACVATPTLDPSPQGGGRRRSGTNPLAKRSRRERKPKAQGEVSPSPMRGGARGGGGQER